MAPARILQAAPGILLQPGLQPAPGGPAKRMIKTLTPAQPPRAAALNGKMEGLLGMTPRVFVAMNLRPDLREPILDYVDRLLIAESLLSRVTKELIAARVSKLNACAY